MPTTIPISLCIADGVVILCFLALLAYRATVTRYEEDQLFLSDESGQHERAEQAEIIRKVDKIQPLVRVVGGVVVLITVVIIAIPVWVAVKMMLQ